jgi:lipid II:glycine glycyltransferase (peptidoglycan interpeptide bridge formation enzyme)
MRWQGTFEMWQNPLFGKIFEAHFGKKRIYIDGVQLFLSTKPVIGSIALYAYLAEEIDCVDKIISFAKKHHVPKLVIYSNCALDDLPNRYKKNAYTYVLDLTREEDYLWKRAGDKTRNMVRKGRKKGIIVKVADNKKEFNDWWNIYTQAAELRGINSMKFKLVEVLFEDKLLSRLFISLINEKVVGGFFFLTNNYPIYWLGAYDRKYKDYSPNNVTMWEAILWFKNNGYELLDFGGADNDGKSSTDRFKESFGSSLMNGYFYHVPISRWKDILLQTASKVAKQYNGNRIYYGT